MCWPENLAAAFGRPSWDVSMYVNVDAASLVGADTLKDGEVVFREGPISKCARLGGFGVLDEVNMAKNEALAVLHATLDFRRVIDVPGYDRILLDDAARFIGTMNYGYAGTRELNEALVVPVCGDGYAGDYAGKPAKAPPAGLPPAEAHLGGAVLRPLWGPAEKCDSSEISTKALDLRGLLSALHLMEKGIPSGQALELGIINRPSTPLSGSWWPMRCGPGSQETLAGPSCSRADMDRQEIESRRAENQFWNGAGNYGLRADFQMYDPDGGGRPVFQTPSSAWCTACMTTPA